MLERVEAESSDDCTVVLVTTAVGLEPPYTPEANPDEVLNRDLKTQLRSQAPAKDRSELRSLARSFMARLQFTPERIKRYFQHLSVRYAA